MIRCDIPKLLMNLSEIGALHISTFRIEPWSYNTCRLVFPFDSICLARIPYMFHLLFHVHFAYRLVTVNIGHPYFTSVVVKNI